MEMGKAPYPHGNFYRVCSQYGPDNGSCPLISMLIVVQLWVWQSNWAMKQLLLGDGSHQATSDYQTVSIVFHI